MRRTLGPFAAPMLLAALALGGASCSQDGLSASSGGPADLSVAAVVDAAVTVDLAQTPTIDPCGDSDPTLPCMRATVAAPFPLLSDGAGGTAERDNGVRRDSAGNLSSAARAATHLVWVANSTDWGGTVSKFDSRHVRELARYPSFTCYSLKTGSTDTCDGTRGCCAVDDWPRYAARKSGAGEPPHQAVQAFDNYPSRTSVASNGDVFVANRAFGGQSSVTRIAHDLSECIDRNHNGKIDTSKDSDGNGLINKDCNNDGIPDTIAAVKKLPCSNKQPQEFFGSDDECVLWTANALPAAAEVAAIAIGAGASPLDVWTGSSKTGDFLRLDGATGLGTADTGLPKDCDSGGGPDGMAIDATGIAWTASPVARKLCWFDTGNPQKSGVVRDPSSGPVTPASITIDPDQNIWVGGQVARYAPDRGGGTRKLGGGTWTVVGDLLANGVAADARAPGAYFVWACTGSYVVGVPAATLPLGRVDQAVKDPGWRQIQMPCNVVGVDADQDVWGLSQFTAARALVDAKGAITQPLVVGGPQDHCPAGDSCPTASADAYSDFTDFSAGLFRPSGSYALLIPGCSDAGGGQGDTAWWSLSWDAEVPAGASLLVHARSGSSASISDVGWLGVPFTVSGATSPLALQSVLSPNLDATTHKPVHDPYLYVEFVFQSPAGVAGPTLRSVDVRWKCP